MIKSFKELFANLKTKGREKIIVAGGEDIETLKALKDCYDYGFGEGILVGGKADILIVPDIVSGNICGKALTYYANYQVGHTLVGTRFPVIIPSRADRSDVKLNCIALSILCSK